MNAATDIERPRVTNNYKKTAPRKPAKPGDVGSGFLGDCFPFTLAAIVTLATDAFDLITDWLAYEAIDRSALKSLVPNNGSSFRTFYAMFPSLVFGLCIVTVVTFGLRIAWYSYMCCARRRMFIEKRDGVPYTRSFLEQYGGDLLTLMQCLSEDLPMSILYFVLQFSISCDLLYTLPRNVLLLSFSATTLSCGVKVLQLIWRSGCFGRREEFNNKIPIQLFRALTVVLFLSSLVISAINITMLTSNKIPKKLTHTRTFDSIGIRNWLREDLIILYEFPKNNQGEMENFSVRKTQIVRIHEVIDLESKTLTVVSPCCLEPPYPLWYNHIKQSNTNLENCSLVYQFQYKAADLAIYYNYAYKCKDKAGTCVSQEIVPDEVAHVSRQIAESVALPTTTRRKDTFGSHVGFSEKDAPHWVKCRTLELVWNATMLNFNPCSLSPLDQ